MAKHTWHGNASAFSAYWQVPILRVMLRSTGLSGVVTPLLATALSGTFRQESLLAVVVGTVLLALSFTSLERGRLVAVIYVSIALVTTLIFGAWFGWIPDVVVVLSYLGVAGGLLFGPSFVYGVVVLVAMLLLLGAALVHARVYEISLPPELSPFLYTTWVRIACGYVLLAGAAAWVLRRAATSIARTEDEAAQALAEAGERLSQTEASRARRLREEHALLDAQKLQSVAQLGDGFAHVVSNSLTVVRCACEDARALSSDEARRAAATSIRRAVKECANRTRDLLLLSRPHTSLPTRVELHREVREHASSLEHRVRGNIRCEFDLQSAGTALVPPTWLQQILTNLLLNAERAIQGSGCIRISTRLVHFDDEHTSTIDRLAPGDYAALEVCDDGEGMTPEVIAHACEPFFTTRGRAGHDGLGLTLVHSMMTQVGGTLALTSDGRGSKVTLYFPMSAQTSETPELRSNDIPTAPPAATPGVERGRGRTAPEQSAALPQRAQGQKSPTARPAPGTLTDPGWRVNALMRTARTAALVAVAAGAVLALLLEDDWKTPTLLVVLMCVPLALASQVRSLPYRLRLALVLGTLGGVAVLFLMWYSFMSPGAVAVLTQAVFLATVFGDRYIALVTLLITTMTFVVGGAVWHDTDSVGSLQPMLFDKAENWVRIGVIFPLVLLVNGHTVLDVFRLAAERVPELDRARRELEHRQRQHTEETEALVRAEGIRGRAERTATAGRVTGVVAHDLNNSLMALLGWAELLEESDSAEEALQNLEQSVEHAEALLKTLRGTAPLGHHGSSLDLGPALARARAMLHAIWQPKPTSGSNLEVAFEAACFVAIQEASFRRLLVNLVTNARHAVGDGTGACSVRLKTFDDGVELSVADTGPGMDKATQARIFEPFFTTKPEQGTGLGLFSVREIVSATSGSIEVQSEPGKGSMFTIRWPLAASGTARARDSVPPASAGSAERVLLVEDEPLVRQLLARGLRSQGYDVVEAEDGDAAARELEARGPFAALCTDAVMPGRSVFELVQEFQGIAPHGVVLLISGYLPENLTPLLTGARVGLLRKPFSHSQLATELERLRRTVEKLRLPT